VTTPAETAQATGAILESGAIMLAAALVFVTIFRRLGLGATLGYIVGGALIGPQLLRLVRDPTQLQSVSEIGIAFLLFIVGLELQPSRLWRLRKDIFGLGLAQVVLCGLAISLLLYVALVISPAASLAIGLPLGLSSTAQVLPMLRSDNELNTPQGERAFSILLFQDLAIVPMITIIAALARVNPDPSAPTGWKLAFLTLAAVVGLVAVGRLILNPLFRLVGRIAERELFIVAGLFTVVGAAAIMHGASPAASACPLSTATRRSKRRSGSPGASCSSAMASRTIATANAVSSRGWSTGRCGLSRPAAACSSIHARGRC
jgi:Kef-type K+ transport system membrane component KefB